MTDLEVSQKQSLHNVPQITPKEMPNRRLLEDIFSRDTQTIYVVYTTERHRQSINGAEVEILKAFILKNDALEYQRWYSMNNFKACNIKEIELE